MALHSRFVLQNLETCSVYSDATSPLKSSTSRISIMHTGLHYKYCMLNRTTWSKTYHKTQTLGIISGQRGAWDCDKSLGEFALGCNPSNIMARLRKCKIYHRTQWYQGKQDKKQGRGFEAAQWQNKRYNNLGRRDTTNSADNMHVYPLARGVRSGHQISLSGAVLIPSRQPRATMLQRTLLL